MTLAEQMAENTHKLAGLAKMPWFIDDPEYREAYDNFMHEAMTVIRSGRKETHEPIRQQTLRG